MSDDQRHDQHDITLGEIHRSVQRIETSMANLVEQHGETRELFVRLEARVGSVEHYVNNQKHSDRLRAQVAQASLAAEASRPSGDVISVKSLIALILAIGGSVGAAVAAYFKATQ